MVKVSKDAVAGLKHDTLMRYNTLDSSEFLKTLIIIPSDIKHFVCLSVTR